MYICWSQPWAALRRLNKCGMDWLGYSCILGGRPYPTGEEAVFGGGYFPADCKVQGLSVLSQSHAVGGVVDAAFFPCHHCDTVTSLRVTRKERDDRWDVQNYISDFWYYVVLFVEHSRKQFKTPHCYFVRLSRKMARLEVGLLREKKTGKVTATIRNDQRKAENG